LRNSPLIAFSLSGLKNAVRLMVEKLGGAEAMNEQDRRDLSASFQKAIIAHLIQKSKKLFTSESIGDVAIVVGVSANLAIRNAYQTLCDAFGKNLHTAPLEYCADNAAMIGRYGIDAYRAHLFSDPHAVTIAPNRKRQNSTQL
jgi:N6-L-threonylcarbamoyladenine synthase